MQEILARGWAHFLARLDGPLHFRFVVQPLVAILLGARAGLRDARTGETPFLACILRCPERRRERIKDALRDVSSVLVVAAVLDGVYQVTVHGGIYLLELVLTVAVLALVPYVLVRGPTSRLARKRRGVRHAPKAPMPIDSPGAYFHAIAARGTEPWLHEAVGCWEIDVDGAGSWTIHVDHGALRVVEGPDPAPTVRIRVDQPEFLRLARGEDHENLVTALLRGEILAYEGDLTFAQKLTAILPLPTDPGAPS